MILLFLINIAINWTLDPNNFYNVINTTKPVVVRFSSQHSSRSLQLQNDWNLFIQQFQENSEIIIAHVNCGKYRRLCLKEGEWNTPEIHLYYNNSVQKYEGGMSHDSLTSWIYNKTGILGKVLDNDLLSPNTRTFQNLLSSQKCVFAVFHSAQKNNDNEIIQEVEKSAKAFRRENNISIAEIDITKFRSFYFDMKIVDLPTFKLFIQNSDTINYEGHVNAKDIINFINDYCDSNRDVNGYLNDKAGIIDEMDDIIATFLKNPSNELVQKAKAMQIENKQSFNYYIELMENVIQYGNSYLNNEETRLEKILQKYRNLESSNETDALQIKLNIISVFISSLI